MNSSSKLFNFLILTTFKYKSLLSFILRHWLQISLFMKKILWWITQFFVITAAVMAGVYLGLLIYDHTQQHKKRVAIKQSLQQIQAELKTNAGKVSLSLDYHQTIKDTLTQASKNKASKAFNILNLWKGIAAPKVQEAAYQLAVAAHRLDQLPAALLKKITYSYTLQKQLESLSSSTTDYFIKRHLQMPGQRAEATQIILRLMTNYCTLEKQLISLYTQALQDIRQTQPNAHKLAPKTTKN